MSYLEDLKACVQCLHELEYSQPALTALTGSSAGGWAVAMFTNLWPHLMQAALLKVSSDDCCNVLNSRQLLYILGSFSEALEKIRAKMLCFLFGS